MTSFVTKTLWLLVLGSCWQLFQNVDAKRKCSLQGGDIDVDGGMTGTLSVALPFVRFDVSSAGMGPVVLYQVPNTDCSGLHGMKGHMSCFEAGLDGPRHCYLVTYVGDPRDAFVRLETFKLEIGKLADSALGVLPRRRLRSSSGSRLSDQFPIPHFLMRKNGNITVFGRRGEISKINPEKDNFFWQVKMKDAYGTFTLHPQGGNVSLQMQNELLKGTEVTFGHKNADGELFTLTSHHGKVFFVKSFEYN